VYVVLNNLLMTESLRAARKTLSDLAGVYSIFCLAESFIYIGGSMETVQDVIRLMNVLLVKFSIPSALRYSKGLPRIYIKKADVHRVRAIVRPFIIPSMLYKIGL